MATKTGEFSERLKAILDLRGMTQTELAQVSGVSKSSISRYISGAWKGKQDTVYSLAHALNVSEAWLMGYDVPMERRLLPDMPSPTIAQNVVTFRVNTDIAAGYDQPAQPLDDWEGAEVEIPTSLLRGRPVEDYFVIRICGNSMYPQYQNGDYVLVLRTDTLDHSGQVAVMLHGEEGTIKKVEYKEGEAWYKLIPINPQYEPKLIEGPEVNTCRIIGIPKLIVREIEE